MVWRCWPTIESLLEAGTTAIATQAQLLSWALHSQDSLKLCKKTLSQRNSWLAKGTLLVDDGIVENPGS